MGKQKLIIIDGPMGAGKTTISDILHHHLEGTALIGVDRIKWFVSGFSRTKEENRVAFEVLFAMCQTYLRNGLTVIVANGFKTTEFLEPYISITGKLNIPLFYYQIEAPIDILIERAMARPKPSEAKTIVGLERIQKNIDSYFEHKYQGARKVFNSSLNTKEEIVQGILEDLVD